MKRFQFNLRHVALLRAHRESRAREIFATAVHAYVEAEAELTRTRARVVDFEARLFAGRRGLFNAAAEAQSFQAYRRESAAEIAAERAVIAARALMMQRQADYMEAYRKLEAVRRHEDRARLAHRVAAGREEQAEFDDLASRRFARPALSRL